MVEDMWIAALPEGPLRGAMKSLPFDRHFRLLTLLKVVLLWLKMELLVFTCFSCEGDLFEDAMGSAITVFQILSIVTTSVLTVYSSLKLASIVGHLHKDFSDLYRAPKLLWVCLTVAIVTVTILNTVMMVCKFGGPGNTLIQVLHEKGCVGILLNIGQTFYVPFFCLANEAALSVSSKASNPKVFSGLTSPRGVWALSIYAAAKFPMEIVVNCVECQFLLPSYMSSLFLFSETWVEAMYGYATVALIIAGLGSYIACGGDGLQPRASDDISPTEIGDRQPDLQRADSAATAASTIYGTMFA